MRRYIFRYTLENIGLLPGHSSTDMFPVSFPSFLRENARGMVK